MLFFAVGALLATEPRVDLSGSLAQVEKHAVRISELAQVIADTAQTGIASGRPYGLAMMESDLASIQIHLRRLNSALIELEKTIEASQ